MEVAEILKQIMNETDIGNIHNLAMTAYEAFQDIDQPVDCREAFEAWWAKEPEFVHPDFAWEIWQAAWNSRPPERESIDRWKLAKWLYDYDAEVDKDGVQLRPWETMLKRHHDAYYHLAGECIEAITQADDQGRREAVSPETLQEAVRQAFWKHGMNGLCIANDILVRFDISNIRRRGLVNKEGTCK